MCVVSRPRHGARVCESSGDCWLRASATAPSTSRQSNPISTEVPDDAIFGRLPERQAPHIYNEREIVDLLAAARRLGPAPGLRGVVYETLFGLLASTGLRISEALALRNCDARLSRAISPLRSPRSRAQRTIASARRSERPGLPSEATSCSTSSAVSVCGSDANCQLAGYDSAPISPCTTSPSEARYRKYPRNAATTVPAFAGLLYSLDCFAKKRRTCAQGEAQSATLSQIVLEMLIAFFREDDVCN